MAHVHAYGDQCPDRPRHHPSGATSCYVTDNTDLILIRESLELVRDRLVRVIDRLGKFAAEQRSLACLAFTHLQPAQPTTVGKRACLWICDLIQDLDDLEFRLANLRARGAKGTTGTQASFLSCSTATTPACGGWMIGRPEDGLLGQLPGDGPDLLAEGRRPDSRYTGRRCSQCSQSCHRSAVAAKPQGDRRTIRGRPDRLVGDGLQAQSDAGGANLRFGPFCAQPGVERAANAGQPMMERTLDDSANRRLTLPQAFLAIDAILLFYQNIASGLVVYPQVIAKHLAEELPFMATEKILMAATARVATVRSCMNLSVSTARPPPPWSSSRAAPTICSNG